MFNSFWSSHPKRNSTPKPTPPSLTPKFTTTTSTFPEYPPRPAHDTQWEHVKPGSPSSPDVDDEGTFERIGYNQVYGGARSRGVPPQPQPPPTPPPPPPAPPSVPLLQEERDRRYQQLDTSLAAQHKAENDIHAGRKDESLARKRRERIGGEERESSAAAVGAEMDALKEENEKLKTMLQLDAAREEIKQERLQLKSEAEKLDAVREEIKQERVQLKSEAEKLDAARNEVKAVRSQLQSEAEKLAVAREEMKEERSQLKSEVEKLDATREETIQERSQLQSEAVKLDAAREEMKQERSQLQYETEKLDVAREEMKQERLQLQSEVERLDAAREEMKQERSRLQSEVERLRGESRAAHEVHKGEVERFKMSLQEHVQRVEHLSVNLERVRKDRDSIRGDLNGEIERLKLTHAKETERARMTLEEVNLDRTQVYLELRKVRKSLDAYTPKLHANLCEIENLRHELSNAKDSKSVASAKLKQRLDLQDKELNSAREESSTLRKEFAQLLALLEDRTSELNSAKDSQRVSAKLQQRLDVQSKELDTAREESSALQKEFTQLLTLLEDQTSELKGAQSVLTTADAFSGAKFTSTLQRLNAEVLQSTALMAESMAELFLHETTTQVAQTDEQLAACKRVSGAIGDAIVHFLGTKKHKDDPILIQIAFQAHLTYHLRWIACAWIIGGDEGYTRLVDAICPSIHEKGE